MTAYGVGWVVAALFLAALPPASAASPDRVVVASKIDTEGELLGNMILSLLAAHGLAVENKLQLWPTNIVRAAILAGQIDIYPEYTG
ncbi:MAG: glycine betaine ABC transporter substrate-binding protein, partial [Stellaceae bacterium]